MTLSLFRRRPGHRAPQAPAAPPALGARVPLVHLLGAVAVAAVILVFGILGFADGLPFFSTEGERVLGMSSNGLLSTISVVTAAVLAGAAVAGPRPASTVMMVIGTLFLVSALASLAVLETGYNLLAFRISNVAFAVVAGLLLLVLGAYGRVGGHLPPDSPYAPADGGAGDPEAADEYPSTPEEFAAERAMRQAERAAVQRIATEDQCRRVAAMALVRGRRERREVWLEFERAS